MRPLASRSTPHDRRGDHDVHVWLKRSTDPTHEGIEIEVTSKPIIFACKGNQPWLPKEPPSRSLGPSYAGKRVVKRNPKRLLRLLDLKDNQSNNYKVRQRHRTYMLGAYWLTMSPLSTAILRLEETLSERKQHRQQPGVEGSAFSRTSRITAAQAVFLEKTWS